MKSVTAKLKNIISIILLGVYLVLPIFILTHSMNMKSAGMMGTTPDCPYMSGEHAVCPINPSIQINLWKNISMSVIPVFNILSVFIFTLFSLFFVLPKIKKIILYIKRQKYRFIYYLYQTLFSQGILNSKAY